MALESKLEVLTVTPVQFFLSESRNMMNVMLMVIVHKEPLRFILSQNLTF